MDRQKYICIKFNLFIAFLAINYIHSETLWNVRCDLLSNLFGYYNSRAIIALKAIGLRYERQMLKEADQTLPIAAEMGEISENICNEMVSGGNLSMLQVM